MRKRLLPPLFVLVAVLWPTVGVTEDRTSGTGPPLLVERFSWRRETVFPMSGGYRVYRADTGFSQATFPGPLAGPIPDQSSGRRSRPRVPSGAATLDALTTLAPEPAVREWFKYTATVRNVGTVPINWVKWDYVFFEPESHKVTTVVRFRSQVKIKPGKKKLLEGYTLQPPGNVTTVSSLRRRSGSKDEVVEIEGVVLADNSVWPRP